MNLVAPLLILLSTTPAVPTSAFAPASSPAPSPWAQASHEPVLVLELAFRVEGSGEPIRLDRLVAVKEDRDGAWGYLADVRIPVAEGGWVSRAVVVRRLRDAGVPASALRVTGPAVCEVDSTNPGIAGKGRP